MIDTGGLSADPVAMPELQALLAGAGETLRGDGGGEVAASLRSLQRVAAARVARRLRCVVTRFDEGRRARCRLHVVAETGLPLALLGTGRRVLTIF